MVSAVRLDAWMPATRATASTSPLVTSRLATAMVVSGFMNTLQRATARRWVASFGVTSTMRARPSGSRWVNAWSDTTRESTRLDAPRLRPGRQVVIGPVSTTSKATAGTRLSWSRSSSFHRGSVAP